MNNVTEQQEREFSLYDLEVVVTRIEGTCTCNMAVGDKFYLKGGKLSLPEEQDFCVYALQSTLPLLPAKQRKNHSSDWMETDSEVTCPDPACKLIMEIKRTNETVFNHNEVSANKLK